MQAGDTLQLTEFTSDVFYLVSSVWNCIFKLQYYSSTPTQFVLSISESPVKQRQRKYSHFSGSNETEM